MNASSLSASLTAALFAVDPVGLGGVVLRGGAGPARDCWLARLQRYLPLGTPWRRIPLHVSDDRLLGGLDLPATLKAGRPMAQRGLLAEADGGVVVLAMADRLSASTAACVSAVIDTQELAAERYGITFRQASRIGVVALDEGFGDDEKVPARLSERLAFHLSLEADIRNNAGDAPFTPDDVAAARAQLGSVRIADEIVEGLCAASLALGIDSVRAPILACHAARAVAALDGRNTANPQDAALAAGLVLAPRATRIPTAQPAQEGATDDVPEGTAGDAQPETVADDASPTSSNDNLSEATIGAVDDVVLEAAIAAIPSSLLAILALGGDAKRSSSSGRAGAAKIGNIRGRPIGMRRCETQRGSRLHLIATLRAAAPWQALRRREAAAAGHSSHARIQVRREDFHIWRFKQRSETTTVFVVDASGSAALHRLAETKGAVELLLADCYVRRDSVAVIAFRGAGAELLLPPTRSLVRAKRSLAGLPGGGGTPLAAGIWMAHSLAESIRRRGVTPTVVLLTDGHGNVARDGTPGRVRATEDALAAGRQMQLDGIATLLLDTSPQPQELARQLAATMGARYVPLPHAGAAALSRVVRVATTS